MNHSLSDARASRLSEVDERKTASERVSSEPGFSRQADGTVRIKSHGIARQLLRGADVRQAGFNADLVALIPQRNASILFKDGEAHRRQRAAAARLFAPSVVEERYRPLMQRESARIAAVLHAEGTLRLDDASLEFTTAIAADVVGLTEGRLSGLAKRLSRFFDTRRPFGAGALGTALYVARSQVDLVMVYAIDLWPAMSRRRRQKRDDLISHLMVLGWSSFDILVECITYATAGISTTREFIVVAAWHLLENDGLKAQFLAADPARQRAILEEILRLEPAVGTLYRRANRTVAVEDAGLERTVAAHERIAIDVRSVNADAAIAGACPHRIDPDRAKSGQHLSFGDGAHRCPGATLAMQETATFLDVLLRVPGVRLASAPRVGFNDVTAGYVLRGAVLVVS